jgi:SsrA-binding protein
VRGEPAQPAAARVIGLVRGVVAIAKSKKKSAEKASPNERVITNNRKALHNYTVLDTLECGIVLHGSEVKSLRDGKISLEESYGRMRDGEFYLINCDIPEYKQASVFNHPPKRPRKLLIHRREFKRFAHQAFEKGLTLVPLKLYFKQGRAKVLMGLCRGKQHHDKRDAMKKAEAQRDMARAMNRRR